MTKRKRITQEKSESASETQAPWSKSKKKRMRKIFAKQRHDKASSGKIAAADGEKELAAHKIAPVDKVDSVEANGTDKKPKSKLVEAFRSRLAGSRFRILNEELYTKTSEESFERFSKNPELFQEYHEGFRHQVESWPVNPVDVIFRWLASKYKGRKCVVADFGCGDAQLARKLLNINEKNESSNFHVHSFDLVSNDPLITACDMAHTPLENKSVDVCVFCLSLMGTNLADFIREAHRVLRDDGRVKIAEVRSRIEYKFSSGMKQSKREGKKSRADQDKAKKDTTNKGSLEEFTDVLAKLGFECVAKDRSNKMFLTLELQKNKKKPDRKLEFTARPCIYKRR